MTPDDATTVIEDMAPYKRDLYNLPASSGSGTINFIKIYFRCYHWQPVCRVKPSLKSNSIVTDGTEVEGISSWVTYSQQWNTNPADGQPWGSDWSVIDALQIGISLKGSSGFGAGCSWLYVEVDYTAVTPKNVSDTGSGADSVPSISVALSLAETGEGVETIPGMSPTIPVIPDTGAGADIIAALEAALSLAETGSGVDAVDVSFYITFVNVADIGEGADVINLDITIPAIEDSGVGVEAILGEYTKFIADQMFSSEYIVPVTASMILSELAAGEDSIAILITPVIAETGEALDSIVVAASLTIAEAGSGVDTPSITVTLTIPEVGAGVDSALAAVSITIADTGEGVEAILRRVLQLARLFIMTRSKTSMAVKTGHKARIKLTFQHRKW
ncbi:hypothetical protein ES708_30416 [subsurface metagenome]